MEQAMDFAQVHGVDPELAKEILLRSWQSALSYMEGTPGEMIKRIASKGGVTQATLDYWENHHPNYVSMGFREGLKRVQELKHRS
jgi:pyrroline-5-carboxylate reductase